MRRASVLMTLVPALVVAGCGGGGDAAPADEGEVTITLSEFAFDPAEIHLRAGTTVTIVLENQGGKDHELMIGREVHVEDGVPHGFESDFFDTVEDLAIDPPEALETSMEGTGDAMSDMSPSTMTGMSGSSMAGMTGDGDHMDMDMGVMIAREPAETARITFTVTEESVGEWQMGCFEEEGAHWKDGMEGTLIVDPA